MEKQQYINAAEQELLHTYNRFPVVLDHGKGVYLYDTDGKNAQLLNHLHKGFVHTIKYHLCNLHGWGIGLSKAVDKLRLHTRLCHPAADLLAAAVNNDRLKTN